MRATTGRTGICGGPTTAENNGSSWMLVVSVESASEKCCVHSLEEFAT